MKHTVAECSVPIAEAIAQNGEMRIPLVRIKKSKPIEHDRGFLSVRFSQCAPFSDEIAINEIRQRVNAAIVSAAQQNTAKVLKKPPDTSNLRYIFLEVHFSL